ncbi:hypothetical protein ACFLWL_00560 [Chloroflexota bacterium]
MRQGCISLGETQCDECHRVIQYAERYLAIEGEGTDEETGETLHYCVECALKKGYAYYKEEKDERTLTFFPQTEY